MNKALWKMCVCTLLLLVLPVIGCSAPELGQVNSVYPVELTAGEKEILNHYADKHFVFNLEFVQENRDISCDIWVEHYVNGEKVGDNITIYGMFYGTSRNSEARTVKERLIITSNNDLEEGNDLWILTVGAGKSEFLLPRLAGLGQTWGQNPGQEFDLGEEVILGYVAAGKTVSGFSLGNSDSLDNILSNEAVYIICMRVHQR